MFLSKSGSMVASLRSILLSVTVVVSAQEVMWGNNQTSATVSNPSQSNVSAIAFGVIVGGAFLLLLAGFIVSGAVQAHRHPERYAPQPASPGRPEQSRAKGLTRAMIESIPIVRFSKDNDKDANAPAERDIELADRGQANSDQLTITDANNPSSDPDAIMVNSNISNNVPATTIEGLSAAQPAFQTRSGCLECLICLVEFVENEEIRLLPCSHKFHPVCIDPWLLNVSGTCPLCRYDLHPSTNDSNAAATSTDDSLPLPPPPPHETSDSAPDRSRFHELRRAHAGPKEYITALRQLHHELENHRVSHVSTSIEAAAHQESRSTLGLRDTFGIQMQPPQSCQILLDDSKSVQSSTTDGVVFSSSN